MRLSYSRINTYQRCPHKYELAYVRRIPVPEPGVFALGLAVHEALKFMHAPGRLELPAKEEVLAEYCRHWENRQETLSEDERDALFQSGLDMLTRHYDRVQTEQKGRYTADVERIFSLPLEGGHSITGRIDRIDALEDGTIEVIDYKTGRRMPTQTDVDRDLQLAIYQLAAQEVFYPDKEVKTTLYYLRHGVSLTAGKIPGLAEKTKTEIMQALAGIEAGEFNPKVDTHCDWCEYRNHCDVFKPVAIAEESRQEIEALVKELAQVEDQLKDNRAHTKTLKARREELEETILGWMYHAGTRCYETSGLRVIGDIKGKITFPAEPVRALLEPLGLWEKVSRISVSKTAIDDLIRSGEVPSAIVPQLWHLSQKEETNIVKLSRLETDDEIDEEAT